MVPTPKRVDSVEVTNKGAAPTTVTVTYDNHRDKTEDKVTVEVAAGGTHHFTEKELDMGGWQAVAPIKSISCGSHSLAPDVHGIVKKLAVHVDEGGALKQQ